MTSRDEKPDWRWLVNTGRVRYSLLQYTPDDVATTDDLELLITLFTRYGAQAVFDNWYELAYNKLMYEAATKKLFSAKR